MNLDDILIFHVCSPSYSPKKKWKKNYKPDKKINRSSPNISYLLNKYNLTSFQFNPKHTHYHKSAPISYPLSKSDLLLPHPSITSSSLQHIIHRNLINQNPQTKTQSYPAYVFMCFAIQIKNVSLSLQDHWVVSGKVIALCLFLTEWKKRV